MKLLILPLPSRPLLVRTGHKLSKIINLAGDDEFVRLLMPEDVVAGNKSQKTALEHAVVVAAIEALRDKGYDLNPYSLADELQVSHTRIVTNGEIMELLALERGEPQSVIAAEYDQLLKKMATLEETIKSLQAQELATESLKSSERLERPEKPSNQKKELAKLKAENAQLCEKLDTETKQNNILSEMVKSLESANQVIAMSIQDAWQQGYHAATLDFHRADNLVPLDESMGVTPSPRAVSDVLLDDLMEEIELLQVPEEEPSADQASSGGYEIPDYMKTGIFEELAEGDEKDSGELDGKPKSFSQDELRDLWQYRFGKSSEENFEAKESEANKGAAAASHKFVGGKHPTQENLSPMPRIVPPEIRRSCKLLGLRPEELTRQAVFDAWKHEMAKPGVHPDTGGDTEMAMYLNTAKDVLVAYLEAQAPKLGKVFGSGTSRDTKEHSKVKPEPKNKK